MTPEETYILLREIDELRERDSARLMDLQHAREEARADGAAAERAAVVAFLRQTLAASETAHASDDLDYAIDVIERGAHIGAAGGN